jgi:hypothetical protein
MTRLVMTKTKLKQGIWEGVLSGASVGAEPQLVVTHQGTVVPHITVTAIEGTKDHAVRIPIPLEAISDGMQTILVTDPKTEARVCSIPLMAGEAMGDDLRVEVDLLRAELDMLKSAFRRHCLETA